MHNKNNQRHNRDVSATYYIGSTNCYDSLSTGVPMLWNSNYADELIYPNPFVQDVKIEFSLKNAARLSMAIFDEQGKFVRQLIANSLIAKGSFQVIWDGHDSSGNKAQNGVYFYKITGEHGQIKTGKVVLMQ